MAAGHGGRDGRRSGAGKVDDGGDEARGRDARIPVRSVDERGRSLVMDGGVRVSAPSWWRKTAVDGVAAKEAGVERVFWRPQSTNGEKGGREEGVNHVFRARLSQMR